MLFIGILLYRIFRDGKKINAKIGHAVIMVLALLSAVIALKAVFDSHNLVDPPTNNLYTLHSWVGICTVALFAFQVLILVSCYNRIQLSLTVTLQFY